MKTILTLVVIIALAFLGYWYYVVAPSQSGNELLVSSSTGTVNSTETDNEIGRRIIMLLSAMRDTELDTKFFTTAAFQSLQDFGAEIKPELPGRRDPFAPIGLEGFSASTTPASSPLAPSPTLAPFGTPNF